MAEEDLYQGSEAAGRGRHQGVVADLGPAGVDRVHLVLVQFLLDRGEVEEPVPEPTDNPGCKQVSCNNVDHPVWAELSSRTKCWVNQTKLLRKVVNTEVCQGPGPG